jgi:cystathionine beta-lyase
MAERHLAKVMSAKRALVVSSGMAAMDVICRLVKPGDEIVAGDDVYGGSSSDFTRN